ncbi:dTDP-4-dehydrorhamnose 3,5-epimerase [Croceiramulus getboli]|nr:dTDP-4-dehydrorhamnose 3,5-epimerase [Flavobacteriaceae bacterium YJPT1-3]
MNVYRTEFKDVFLINPDVHRDARGYFVESFHARTFQERTGLDISFVQDNESVSTYGVLRGLHFQKPPHAQSKLIRVVEGNILDVGVDLRATSKTFGQVITQELSADNGLQLFLPKGFAHGFSVLSDQAKVLYKCDTFYNPQAESGIVFNDTDLDIDWEIPDSKALVSEKDRSWPTFAEVMTESYAW